MTPPTHRKFAQSMMVADGEEAGSRWFARAIIRPGRRGQKAPYRVEKHFSGNKKAPGAVWLQGRIDDPWYHPGCLLRGGRFGL